MNKVERSHLRRRYWYVFFLLIHSYHGQSLIEVAEGRAAPGEGLALDSMGLAGLKGSYLGEKEGKPVVQRK